MLGNIRRDVSTPNVKVPTTFFPPHFDVAELLEVTARAKDVRALDETVSVEVVVSTEDNVHDTICLFSELVVVRLALMTEANDNFSTLLPELRHKFFCCRGCRLVDDVWGQTVDGRQPFPLSQTDETDFDAV